MIFLPTRNIIVPRRGLKHLGNAGFISGGLVGAIASSQRRAINLATSFPWEDVWFASNLVGYANGSQYDWPDQSATKNLTNATSSKRPFYRSSVAAFNNQPMFQGDTTKPVYVEWSRGSSLAYPYTVVVIGAHPSGLTTYSTMAADLAASPLTFFPWLRADGGGALSAQAYTSATPYAGMIGTGYDASPHLWTTVIDSAANAARFGLDGFNGVAAFDASHPLTGLTLWQYPGSSGSFASNAHIGFVGVFAGRATTQSWWKTFLAAAQTHYGLNLNNRTLIAADGASRAQGADFGTAVMGNSWTSLLHLALSDPNQVVNQGRNSLTTSQIDSKAAATVDAAFSETLGAAKKILVVCNYEFNSIVGGDSGATCYAALCNYIDARRAATPGLLVLICTDPPTSNTTAPQQTELDAFNSLVLANAGSGGGNGIADGVCDLDGDSGLNPATSTNYHDQAGNYIHWNAAGCVIVKDLIKTALSASPFSVN